MSALFELLDSFIDSHPVDRQRIYLTGLSMGGFGTWDAIARRPDFFAAAIPICGGGDLKTASRIKDLPIWCFHGGADPVVAVELSRTMVDAIKAAGGHPKYTEYEGVAHDSWTQTYKNNELFQWLFQQSAKQ
jgi:predicted peptidase